MIPSGGKTTRFLKLLLFFCFRFKRDFYNYGRGYNILVVY